MTEQLDNLRSTFYSAIRREPAMAPHDANGMLITSVFLVMFLGLLCVSLGYHGGFVPINELGRHMPEVLLQVLTSTGDSLVAVSALALLARRRPRLLLTGLVAALLAFAISHAMKQGFDAARPFAVLGDQVHVVGPLLKRLSFPSGHATTAFVLAGVFAIQAGRSTRHILYLCASAVALSRVLVGVHWPIDVLAGAAIGLASVGLALKLTTRLSLASEAALYAYGLTVLLAAGCGLALLIGAPDYPLARPCLSLWGAVVLAHLFRDFSPVVGPAGEASHTGSALQPR